MRKKRGQNLGVRIAVQRNNRSFNALELDLCRRALLCAQSGKQFRNSFRREMLDELVRRAGLPLTHGTPRHRHFRTSWRNFYLKISPIMAPKLILDRHDQRIDFVYWLTSLILIRSRNPTSNGSMEVFPDTPPNIEPRPPLRASTSSR